ncbi:hypothetical protein WJ89_03425 [Burkholderia ubonensis]|nr:hypothetical protein WJ89_03425 [Burkholderia ubonensis]KWD33068.1 hypothetical protein WL63_20950 [Burkholderia ubonensis]KWD39083.1 hypothetical protein WL64_16415 [Burkholderia ubonensis]KWO93441.1 hypothetical protein WM35_25505 [Burkholderia ubonensis]
MSEDRQPLAHFLNHSGTPLSLRATAGFYKRICESTLRFKPGFKEAIAAHLKKMEAATIIATPKAPKKLPVESVEMA